MSERPSPMPGPVPRPRADLSGAVRDLLDAVRTWELDDQEGWREVSAALDLLETALRARVTRSGSVGTERSRDGGPSAGPLVEDGDEEVGRAVDGVLAKGPSMARTEVTKVPLPDPVDEQLGRIETNLSQIEATLRRTRKSQER